MRIEESECESLRIGVDEDTPLLNSSRNKTASKSNYRNKRDRIFLVASMLCLQLALVSFAVVGKILYSQRPPQVATLVASSYVYDQVPHGDHHQPHKYIWYPVASKDDLQLGPYIKSSRLFILTGHQPHERSYTQQPFRNNALEVHKDLTRYIF